MSASSSQASSSSHQPRTLNLTTEQWSRESFQNSRLAVINEGANLLLQIEDSTQANAKPSGYLTSVAKGVKFWTLGKSDNSSIYSVSQAINTIAEQAITEAKMDYSSLGKKKGADIQKIQLIYTSMMTLKNNLEAHNEVIGDYNKRFWTNKVACSNHDAVLSEISQWVKDLGHVQKDLKKNHFNIVMKSTINDFTFDIMNMDEFTSDGKIDKARFIETYKSLMALATELECNEDQQLMQSVSREINQCYVLSLIEIIEQNRLEIPPSLDLLFRRFISSDEKDQRISDGRIQLLNALKKFIEPEMIEQPTPNLIMQIQKEFFGILTAQLVDNEKQRDTLKPLIAAVYTLGEKFHPWIKEAEKNGYKEGAAILAEAKKQTNQHISLLPPSKRDSAHKECREDMAELTKRWNNYKFPSLLGVILNSILKESNIDLKKTLADDFHVDLQKLEGAILNVENKWTPEQFNRRYSEKAEMELGKLLENYRIQKGNAHSMAKFEKREKKETEYRNGQLFSFSQSAWGNGEILGTGACSGINFRWIRKLMTEPRKQITSHDDLKETNEVQKNTSPFANSSTTASTTSSSNQISQITLSDRIAQATHSLEIRLGKSKGRFGVGEAMLRKYNMSVKWNTNYMNISAVIDEAEKKKNNTLLGAASSTQNGFDENGIFHISGWGNPSKSGHAFGMQILSEDNIYRFWDVNYGFYQYDTFAKMKNAFKFHTKTCYDDYTTFYACQYSQIQ